MILTDAHIELIDNAVVAYDLLLHATSIHFDEAANITQAVFLADLEA